MDIISINAADQLELWADHDWYHTAGTWTFSIDAIFAAPTVYTSFTSFTINLIVECDVTSINWAT